RIGFGSTAVVTGDLTQIDLPRHQKSGLKDALDVLRGVDGIGFTFFEAKDVVRHALVARRANAYDARDRQDAETGPGASPAGRPRPAAASGCRRPWPGASARPTWRSGSWTRRKAARSTATTAARTTRPTCSASRPRWPKASSCPRACACRCSATW